MKSWTLCCLAGCLILFCGCGQPGPSVVGTVLLDGDPLPSGRIRFVPVEGTRGPDAGAVIEEGKYSVGKSLTVGKYRVEIHGVKESTMRKERDPIIPVHLIPAAMEAVPPAYNAKSELIKTVEAGVNTLDFDLTTNRKAK
jgi:hypothetical protein